METLKLKQEQVVSIPTGIDLQRFTNARKAQLGIPEGAFVFGIVATLRSWKGHQFLLDAFKTLNGDFHLVIAGDGPQRPFIEKQISSDRIHLLGQREDVPEVLAAWTASCCPPANEGVPQAIMQAMARGCRSSPRGSARSTRSCPKARPGSLVPPRDSQALAAAMLALAASPEKGPPRPSGKTGRPAEILHR
jgi:glycosyltransferase involved in cell wall biosynthesis